MTKKLCNSPGRVAIWQAMADHFLDTETRHDIPLTALLCVESRFPQKEARDIWRSEVYPAVGFNLLCVAGEWAGWNEEWLVGRIERLRERRGGLANWIPSLCDRARALPMEGVWRAIERVMGELLELANDTEREQRARDFAFLARHYFDFCPDTPPTPRTSDRTRLDSIDATRFGQLMSSALVPGEASAAHARLLSVFDEREALQ